MFKTLFLCFFACFFATSGFAISSSFQPAVSINTNGNVVACWRSPSSDGSTLIQQATITQGSGWSKPSIVCKASNAFFPFVALNDQDQAFFIWEFYNGKYFEIHSGIAPFGSAPTQDVILSQYDSSNPQIALGKNGDAICLWHQRMPSGHAVSSAYYTPNVG
jgi:hypothetical protein